MTKPQTKAPKLSEAQMHDLWREAYSAGLRAGEAARPTPMVVSDEISGYTYAPVMDGACGFAWVKLRPANSGFARFLIKKGLARTDSYAGGANVWVREFGQSYERKIAMAYAMAEIFDAAGFKAYGQGRLD